MALSLRSDMCLEPRPEDGYVALFSRFDEEGQRPTFRLHPYQGLALALHDGRRDDREIRTILASVLDRSAEDAESLMMALQRRFRQFMVDRHPGDIDTDALAVDDRELGDFLFATAADFRSKREAAPSALFWVVTEYCDKKCRYCYMNAIFTDDAAPDLDFNSQRVGEIIDEAAAIGVNRIILSGGEPFLRPDLIDLIGHMVAAGLDVVPITKSRIVGERMAALAATGLREIHISLDSHRRDVVDFMVGVPGSFDQMTDTIRAARRYDIDIVLRPLLTATNVRDLEGLLDFAAELGVARVMMDVYGNTCGRHDSALGLAPGDRAWLDERWPALEAKYADSPMRVYFDLPATSPGDEAAGCVEGLRGLTFLPDGRVTKCDHWRKDDRLVYGDLRTQSILDAWNGEALKRINFPEPEAYAGTICYHCKNLQTCDYVRGRCSMSSLIEYGKPTAPDTYCPIGAFERHLPNEAASCGSGCGCGPSPAQGTQLVQLGGSSAGAAS
ncbi:MAG: radical SAM protein [Acidobacteriota bacterium]